jgi:hypothetical protein
VWSAVGQELWWIRMGFPWVTRQPWKWTPRVGISLVVLILGGGWIGAGGSARPGNTQNIWRVGAPVAIAVHGGRASFSLPTPAPTSQALIVVSALARSGGPFPVELAARGARQPSDAMVARPVTRLPVRRDHVGNANERACPAPGNGMPPLERFFHLMVRDGDLSSAANYTRIRGVLAGVGRRVAVYVASDDLDQVRPDVVTDVVRTFDDRIYPLVAQSFGAAEDVDGDGRFTVLFSSWLGHLAGGRYAVDGFVRVADLDCAHSAPFGNRCDMMYLNTTLKAGSHLRTIMAHEYMHAVTFSQKTLRNPRGADRAEEEGWLDEAIAHLAEDLHGFSSSNIDYRVSAFLSRPERYSLVVEDYYAADLFRSHGNRGCTYLFLKWCADRCGAALLPALVQSKLCGIANLEAATGASFADLFRSWTLALYCAGLARSVESGDPLAELGGYRSLRLRGPNVEWELAGPRFVRLSPGGPPDRWNALGTSTHFAVVDGSRTGAVEIEVSGPPGAELQVTVLPLGSDLARLQLSIAKVRGPGGELCVRAAIKEQNGVPVRLSALSWERLAPPPVLREDVFRCARLDTLGIAAAFGTAAVAASGEVCSGAIPLRVGASRLGPLVFKVVGTDARGRRVTAWADLDAKTEEN